MCYAIQNGLFQTPFERSLSIFRLPETFAKPTFFSFVIPSRRRRVFIGEIFRFAQNDERLPETYKLPFLQATSEVKTIFTSHCFNFALTARLNYGLFASQTPLWPASIKISLREINLILTSLKLRFVCFANLLLTSSITISLCEINLILACPNFGLFASQPHLWAMLTNTNINFVNIWNLIFTKLHGTKHNKQVQFLLACYFICFRYFCQERNNNFSGRTLNGQESLVTPSQWQ